MSVSLSSVDKRNQANNPRKRNSPLNMCVEEIRVEISFEELVYYVLCVNRVYIFSFFIKVSLRFMHTCIHCNFFQKNDDEIFKNAFFLAISFLLVLKQIEGNLAL